MASTVGSETVHAVKFINENSSDNKLKYAILFGAPLVAGLAVYWYMNRKKSKSSSGLTKSSSSGGEKVDARAAAQKKIDDQIHSADPSEQATGYKNKGNNFFKFKKYKEAIECYTDAIKVCPVDKKEYLATFYQNRAAAYENLNLTENVIKDCTKALEYNKHYAKAYLRRARAYESQGELRKCLEDATCCSVLEQFQNQPALVLADRVLKTFGAQKAKDVYATRTPQLPSASFLRNYLRSFIEDPVVIDIEKRVNNDPTMISGPPTGYDKAVQSLIDENWDDVIGYCGDEIERASDKEKVDKALLLRAGFFIISGQVEASLSDINTLLNRENLDIKVKVNAYIKLATANVHTGQVEEALATFEKAIELDPNNADIYLHRAQVFLLLDKIDQTLKNLELASSLRPDYRSAAAQLAYTQFRSGSRFGDRHLQDEAMKNFENCIKKFPDCAEVYFLYAQLMTEMEKFDFAEKYLKTFIEKDPQDASGLVHMGLLAMQSKQDIESAIKYIKEAIDKDPKCQFAYETLGTIFAQRGQTADAVMLLDKAISLAQTEGEIAHIYALKTSAEIQLQVMERLGVEPPSMPV